MKKTFQTFSCGNHVTYVTLEKMTDGRLIKTVPQYSGGIYRAEVHPEEVFYTGQHHSEPRTASEVWESPVFEIHQ